MNVIEKIKSFLFEVENISIGYNELNFISADRLEEGQVGYRIDLNGNSFITGLAGDWKEEWMVIGNDNMGDPIFVNYTDVDLPVYTSIHGQDEWDAILIAISLDEFRNVLTDLKELSNGRHSPVEIEQNPVSEKELYDFFNNTKNHNGPMDIWWWQIFLDNTNDKP